MEAGFAQFYQARAVPSGSEARRQEKLERRRGEQNLNKRMRMIVMVRVTCRVGGERRSFIVHFRTRLPLKRQKI